MIKIVVIDKNINSRENIDAILKKIENVQVVGLFDDFSLAEVEYDLAIFDVNSGNCSEILSEIKEIKGKKEDINFIALSYEMSSTLVSAVLKEGISDFLIKPIIPNVLEASIKKLKKEENAKAKTISVFSNKGGIGKTSVAVNLAYEIYKKTNDKVCVLDLSFNSQDASVFLDIEQKFDIDYVLKNIEKSNEELLLSLIGNYKDTKLYILEAQEEIAPELKYTPGEIGRIINSLKNIFDYIVIDTTSIINEMNVTILNNSDLILLLASTNMASIRNCQKCYELFDKIGYGSDKIKLIINRYIENQEITLKDIENSIGKEVFDTIPNNYLTLIDAINLGQAVGDINPQSNIAKAYARITDKILKLDFATLSNKANYNHGIFNLLQRMGE